MSSLPSASRALLKRALSHAGNMFPDRRGLATAALKEVEAEADLMRGLPLAVCRLPGADELPPSGGSIEIEVIEDAAEGLERADSIAVASVEQLCGSLPYAARLSSVILPHGLSVDQAHAEVLRRVHDEVREKRDELTTGLFDTLNAAVGLVLLSRRGLLLYREARDAAWARLVDRACAPVVQMPLHGEGASLAALLGGWLEDVRGAPEACLSLDAVLTHGVDELLEQAVENREEPDWPPAGLAELVAQDVLRRYLPDAASQLLCALVEPPGESRLSVHNLTSSTVRLVGMMPPRGPPAPLPPCVVPLIVHLWRTRYWLPLVARANRVLSRPEVERELSAEARGRWDELVRDCRRCESRRIESSMLSLRVDPSCWLSLDTSDQSTRAARRKHAQRCAAESIHAVVSPLVEELLLEVQERVLHLADWLAEQTAISPVE